MKVSVFIHAIGHPIRRDILKRLRNGNITVAEEAVSLVVDMFGTTKDEKND